MKMNMFVNDNYRLLKFLYDNQTEVLNEVIIPLTQTQISVHLDISKGKVNSIMKELIDSGYIFFEVRGKYRLSDISVDIIKKVEKIESELGEIEK